MTCHSSLRKTQIAWTLINFINKQIPDGCNLKIKNMRNDKHFLTTIVLTAFILTVVVIFFSINKKPVDKVVEPISVTKLAANDTFRVRPLTNVKYERTAQRLNQGEYLVLGVLECFVCHSDRDWDAPGAPPIVKKYGSGHFFFEDSTSRITAPNITPDNETGAGKWTDDMFARAIREGVGHDGRALSYHMPYADFKNLSDEDLASVVVYIRSIPPVHNNLLQTKIPAGERSGIERSLTPITQPILAPDFSDPKKRGRYLVGLASCAVCHTSWAEYNPGLFAGGNLIDHEHGKAFSANITSDPSGMAYGVEGFIFVMRTGKGGTLSHNMPWVAYKNMTDDDLKAIYKYLGTIPPSQHYISSQLPFTHCAICGLEHGLGEKNKRARPGGIKLDPDLYNLYAGTYLNEEFNSTYTIFREGNKLFGQAWENAPKTELIPQSEVHFLAPGWRLPVSFVKDKMGNVIQLVEDSDAGLVWKKIK